MTKQKKLYKYAKDSLRESTTFRSISNSDVIVESTEIYDFDHCRGINLIWKEKTPLVISHLMLVYGFTEEEAEKIGRSFMRYVQKEVQKKYK